MGLGPHYPSQISPLLISWFNQEVGMRLRPDNPMVSLRTLSLTSDKGIERIWRLFTIVILVVAAVMTDVLAAMLPASFLLGLHVSLSILSLLPEPPSNNLPINYSLLKSAKNLPITLHTMR